MYRVVNDGIAVSLAYTHSYAQAVSVGLAEPRS